MQVFRNVASLNIVIYKWVGIASPQRGINAHKNARVVSAVSLAVRIVWERSSWELAADRWYRMTCAYVSCCLINVFEAAQLWTLLVHTYVNVICTLTYTK